LTEPGTRLFSGYKWLKNYNLLPISKGLSKQTVKFVRMVEFCDIIVAKISKMGNNIKEAEAQQAHKLLRLMDKKHGRK